MASDSGSTYSCSHEDSIHFSAAVNSAQVGSSHSPHVTSPNQLPRSDLGCEATMRHRGRKEEGRKEESRAFTSNFSGKRFHRFILPQKFFASKLCHGPSLFSATLKMQYKSISLLVALGGRWPTYPPAGPPAPAPDLVLPPFLLYL